jgi:hypothetical protein
MPTRKNLTWQLVVVIVASLAALTTLIVGLAVFADWSDGAIVALTTAFAGLIVNTIMILKNQARTVETLDDQNVTLEQIKDQTNGLSAKEREDIAERAAAKIMRGRL